MCLPQKTSQNKGEIVIILQGKGCVRRLYKQVVSMNAFMAQLNQGGLIKFVFPHNAQCVKTASFLLFSTTYVCHPDLRRDQLEQLVNEGYDK
jgi:hypothetical protein